MLIYGTDCLKAAIDADEADLDLSRQWLTRELHIVQPRIVVTLGEDAREFVNSIRFPLAVKATAPLGQVEQWTPTIEVLAVPDMDAVAQRGGGEAVVLAGVQTLGGSRERLPPCSR